MTENKEKSPGGSDEAVSLGASLLFVSDWRNESVIN